MNRLFLIVAMIIAAAGVSDAQPADATLAARIPIARRLYDEGVDAYGKGRWSIALDRFKASYELAPRAQTLFNLASSQGQTGRLVEAGESYRRFLRETVDGRFAELRVVATEQLELLDKQIPQASFEIANLEAGDSVAIDELELPHGVLREPLPMNPGPHVARIQRGTQVIATRTFALAAGAAESIRIELPIRPLDLALHRAPAPAPAPITAPPPPVDRGPHRSWSRSPWLWSGVAVVLVAGATGAYLLTRPDGTVIH